MCFSECRERHRLGTGQRVWFHSCCRPACTMAKMKGMKTRSMAAAERRVKKERATVKKKVRQLAGAVKKAEGKKRKARKAKRKSRLISTQLLRLMKKRERVGREAAKEGRRRLRAKKKEAKEKARAAKAAEREAKAAEREVKAKARQVHKARKVLGRVFKAALNLRASWRSAQKKRAARRAVGRKVKRLVSKRKFAKKVARRKVFESALRSSKKSERKLAMYKLRGRGKSVAVHMVPIGDVTIIKRRVRGRWVYIASYDKNGLRLRRIIPASLAKVIEQAQRRGGGMMTRSRTLARRSAAPPRVMTRGALRRQARQSRLARKRR